MFDLIRSVTGWKLSSKGCLGLMSWVALILTPVFVWFAAGIIPGILMALFVSVAAFFSDNIPLTASRIVGFVIGTTYVILNR